MGARYFSPKQPWVHSRNCQFKNKNKQNAILFVKHTNREWQSDSCQEVMECHELYKQRMAYWESPSPPEKSRQRLEATPSHEDNLPTSESPETKEGDGESLEDSCANSVARVPSLEANLPMSESPGPKGEMASLLRTHVPMPWLG